MVISDYHDPLVIQKDESRNVASQGGAARPNQKKGLHKHNQSEDGIIASITPPDHANQDFPSDIQHLESAKEMSFFGRNSRA